MNIFSTLLTGIALLIPPAIFAQSVSASIPVAKKETRPGAWKTSPSGMIPAKKNAPQKTSGTASRLTANYDGMGTAAGGYRNLDSSFYIFSGSHRGIDPSEVGQEIENGLYVNADFDTGTNWSWDAASVAYKPSFRYLKTYTSGEKLKVSRKQIFTSGNWRDDSRFSVYYNSKGYDTGYVSETWDYIAAIWINEDRVTYTYDAAGNMLSEVNQHWNTGPHLWENVDRVTATYDGSNNLKSGLQENWSMAINNWRNYSKDDYAYSTSNNLQSISSMSWDTTSNSWFNSYQAAYYYDGFGLLIAYALRNGNGSSWLNYDSTSYPTLTLSGAPMTTLHFTWNGSAWRLQNRISSAYGTGEHPIVSVEELWNGSSYTNSNRSFSTYNSFDQPTTIYSEYWTGSTWATTPSSVIKRYYYEVINTTGVQIVAGATSGISGYLFPVPASEKLSIATQWQTPQAFTATIYDATGKLVMQWRDQANGWYTKDLSVTLMPSGVYYLRLQGATAQWQHSFTVRH